MRKIEIAAVIILVAGLLIGVSMKKSEKVEVKPMKNMTEAKYYESTENNSVKCNLCPRACDLADGQVGSCRARKNIGGKLYTLSYGKTVAVNVDPVEKKPLFHFMPGSLVYSIGCAGCNLHCKFCQNWTISQASPEEVPYEAMTPEQVVEDAIKSGSESVAFTYNEPTIFYEFMLETAKLAKEKGLKTIMVTNGYINQEPLVELIKYIDAANIDLKGFTEKFYSEYTTASLKPVLETIKTMKKMGVFIEITNLIIPDANDKDEEILGLINWVKENTGTETPLHFSRFFPAHKLKDRPPTPVETIEKARKMAIDAGMKFVYTGNLRTENSENTICPHCGKKVVERSGFQIVSSNMKNGKCGYCGGEINGVWKKKPIRRPAVAGMWYPADKAELLKMMETLDKKSCPEFEDSGEITGLIVPHAGFIYSGNTAACGFKALKDQKFDTVILLGTSHKYRADVISIFDGSEAETPLGNLKIDSDLTQKLIAKNEKITFIKQIHDKEHSLEAELPFIKYYLGNPEIVLVLASTENETLLQNTGIEIAKLIKESGKKVLLVASTDMSHYHPYDEAVKMDKLTISTLESGDYSKLKDLIKKGSCELCGHDSLLMFFSALKELGAEKGRLVKYENSGDAVPGSGAQGVVGYMSMIFETNEEISMNYYDEKERKYMIELARNSISYALKNKKEFVPQKPAETKLNETRAVFVTLKINDELRGCIGSMVATESLFQAVSGMAHSAAFNDPRFAPLTADELNKINIEISVLTPMEKVASWKDIKNGIDGVYIKKGYHSGVFLPQVATETGWNLETFLSNLCTHKAGLPADCYKDPSTEIYKYQVELFGE